MTRPIPGPEGERAGGGRAGAIRGHGTRIERFDEEEASTYAFCSIFPLRDQDRGGATGRGIRPRSWRSRGSVRVFRVTWVRLVQNFRDDKPRAMGIVLN
jgi:hypothetical protein